MITADTTTVQPPALPITVEHAARWQGLLQKAQERRLHIWTDYEFNRYTDEETRNIIVFGVTSHSAQGTYHKVRVERVDEAVVTSRCDCFAGSVPMGCTHAALAIETAGWWPFPIHAQTEMEITDGLAVDSEQPLQPARYAVGQAVKLVWQQRRTFWVHSATFDGTGWRYQLADEARRVVLEADEHKVRPATSKRSVAA